MSKYLYIKRLITNGRPDYIKLGCVLLISLLLGACASGNTKQALSSEGEARQVSAKANDDEELVCRRVKITGSRLSQKVCAKKEVWAKTDNERKEDADKFREEYRDRGRVGTSSSVGPGDE